MKEFDEPRPVRKPEPQIRIMTEGRNPIHPPLEYPGECKMKSKGLRKSMTPTTERPTCRIYKEGLDPEKEYDIPEPIKEYKRFKLIQKLKCIIALILGIELVIAALSLLYTLVSYVANNWN